MECCWHDGFTLSETIFVKVLGVKEHPQKYQEPGFSPLVQRFIDMIDVIHFMVCSL